MPSINILVLGLGTQVFGLEQRAVTALKHIPRVKPYFLISKWEDGSVSKFLKRHSFEFSFTPFGYLGRAKPIWTLVTLLHLPLLYFAVIRVYLRKHCAIILLLCPHPFMNAFIPLVLLKWFARSRLVFYLGDIPRNDSIHRILAFFINRLADSLIVNSQKVKQGLMSIGIDERKIQVVYNGKDLSVWGVAPPEPYCQKYGWPAETVLVGYVGQFSENKGIWDFVKAAEIVLQQEPRCRFVLVGKENTYQNKIAEYVNAQPYHKSIAFTGWSEDVERAFAALDILVVPSRHEDPAPNVNIEAMASGVAVVATKAGGTPEMVLDGETGFLVEKENPEQIAKCILRLARDKGLREKMGRAGKARTYQMFNIHKNASLVEEVLLHG